MAARSFLIHKCFRLNLKTGMDSRVRDATRLFIAGRPTKIIHKYFKLYSTSAEAEKANWEARCDLAVCYRILSKLGFGEGICNHLSLSCPAKDGSEKVMLLFDYGLQWSEVTASSLVGLSLKDPRNPRIVEGNGQPDISAICIHNGIHQFRSDIRCVLHAHPPYTTALTCLKDPTLRMVHQNATRFYNDICYDTEYDGVATGTTAIDEGFRLGKIIGNCNIMFMGNHGVLVLGKSAADAFDQLYFLERAAMYQVLAMSTGKELAVIPEELIKRTCKEIHGYLSFSTHLHFKSIKRLLENDKPFYAS